MSRWLEKKLGRTPRPRPQERVVAVPAWHDGEKYPGGFGHTLLLTADYWTLRLRSSQLFRTNLYARGIVRRLVTNVINTGLHLEATPEESILGRDPGELADWTEEIETRFRLWEASPRLCDAAERASFGALQEQAYLEALVSGDVLVTLRQDQRTGLPRVHLVSGSAVRTPLEQPRRGNRIEHGVEIDGLGRHVAYWVTHRDGTSKRMPAYGEKSNRRIAWLVYATDMRLDDVRGEPILSIVLQSLKEIDRYRDSVQRKAVINSMIAMFIQKTEDKPGTMPITGGAVRKGTVTEQGASGERSYRVTEHIPGMVLEELQQGEEPKAFPSHGTDEKFGDFEAAMVQAFAWSIGVPPEILRLSFSNNYSASQAAINEFKMTLNHTRTRWGDDFCAPIYVEWLLAEALNDKVDAPGLLDSWRDPLKYDAFAAWTLSEWAGQIKPAVDLSKLVRGYREMIEEGLITRDRAARELTGMKYSRVAKQLSVENELLLDARRPLMELEQASAPRPTSDTEDDADPDPDRDEDERVPAPPPELVRFRERASR